MRGRIVTGGVLAALAATVLWWWSNRGEADPLTVAIPGEGQTLQLEVVNGSGIDGLAAAKTRALRRYGLDVVYFGTAATDTFTFTQIIVRRGDTTGVGKVRAVLGVGAVTTDLDSLRLLDITVILGRDADTLGLRP